MNECPSINGGMCPQVSNITDLQQNMAVIMSLLTELRDDMKTVKLTVATIATLELEHRHQKEALDRAFTRIKELEDKIMKHQTEFDQIRGMKSLAIGLWTILAGGLGLVIVKVFEVIK